MIYLALTLGTILVLLIALLLKMCVRSTGEDE